VARVRNLGHPRRLVLAFDADGPVSPGEAVLAAGADAGTVTSVAGLDGESGGHAALARVRWDAREAALVTANGIELRPRQG
jgi:folate-binding Fe-S cluster repair protein YgfZ